MNGIEIEEIQNLIPYSSFVSAYVDSKREAMFQSIVSELSNRYGGKYSKEKDSLSFGSGSVLSYVRRLTMGKAQIFLLVVGSDKSEKSLNSIPSYDQYDKALESLKEALPERSDSTCSLRVAYTTGEREAENLLNQYIRNTGEDLRSAGLTRGNLLAQTSGSSLVNASRDFIVFNYEPEAASNIIWKLFLEVCLLTLYIGEMSRLYSRQKPIFDQIEKKFKEIIGLESYLRLVVDKYQQEDLEKILKDIHLQFSHLLNYDNSMRHDYVKAEGLLRDLKSLLKKWNEKPIEQNPTNLSSEIEDFQNMIEPFKSYIDRAEALMTQLNAMLDTVRAYIGIKQTKLSIAEQNSSKEQLVRLVNLQEILHKLEMLIIAVYLTEMLRIVFEAFFHEWANILTVIFIPIALLVSIFIVHKLHEKFYESRMRKTKPSKHIYDTARPKEES